MQRVLKRLRALSTAALLWTLLLSGAGWSRMMAGEAPEKPSRLEIVERSIRFHGGDLYTASETRLQLCSRSGCYELVAEVDGGRFRLEVEGRVRGVQRRVRVTNQTVELWQDGVSVEVDPERERPLRDWVMARVYFCFLPFRLNDDSVFQQDLGTDVWSGRPLRKVKITFAPGSSTDADDEYLYWFDPESGRVEQFAYSYSGDPGGLRFRRGFDYRRVGGILFFNQENLGVEGPGLSVDQIAPEFSETLRRVSTVELRDIRVRPLAR